jgi:transposase
MKDGDDSLSRTKYIWLTSFENLSEKQQAVFDATYDQQLQTGKAWAYKEMLRDLWSQTSATSATTYFNEWYKRVIHTKLSPMKTVARSIKERLQNVVNYCTHRITNAVAEGMNSKIMSIKRRVGGFRNRQHFKTAIFSTAVASASTHNNPGWTSISELSLPIGNDGERLQRMSSPP